MSTIEEADVVVVGSGAGGGTLAWQLAKEGVSVVVLEKGPHHQLSDFEYHDELEVSKRAMFLPHVHEDPHMVSFGDSGRFSRSRDGWISQCVGGGTVHMSGFFLRLHPDDLAVRSKVGVPEGSTAEDWPITYEELARGYDRVEDLLGVGGVAGQNPFDAPRKPYPLPPIAEHPFTAPFDAAAKQLGWHPFSTPRAVLSRPHGGRPACHFCGYCGSFGCETGAKSSVHAALIPEAIATGKCKIVSGAMVTEVALGKDGRASEVRFLGKSGAGVARGRVVVVSCGSIESARLLLMSNAQRGVATSSGLVGKNLFFSTLAAVHADFDRAGKGGKFPGWDSSLPFLGRSIQDFYRPKSAPSKQGGTLRFDLAPKGPLFRAQMVALEGGGRRALWGQPLKDALRKHFREQKTLEAEWFGEMNPHADMWVGLDPEVRDKWGLPVARIQAKLLGADVEMARFAADRAQELFGAMGADHVGGASWGTPTWVLQHGTCRMGKDPARSVLDPSCRAHDVKNLYVVDGSFMPSAGGVPTTLTIMANSLRVAGIIRERFAAKEH